MNKRMSPARIALLYAAFASLWIFASDQLLILAIPDQYWRALIGSSKGILFVVITASLLFLLLRSRSADTPNAAEAGTLKTRNPIAIFLALGMIVPLFGFGITKIYGPRIQQAAYDDLAAIAQLKSQQIETWLRERQDDADEITERAGIVENAELWLKRGDTDAKSYVLARMAAMDRTHGYEPVLLRADGRPASTTISDPIAEKVWRELLSLTLSSGKPQHSELYRDSHGKIRLDYLVPLRLGNPQHTVGVVVMRAPVERFLYPLIQTWPTASPSAETVLGRRDGDHVIFLDELRHRKGTALSLRLPLDTPGLPVAASILSDKPLTMEGSDYRGIRVLAATRPVQGTDWHLVAKVDKDEVMALLDEMLFWVSMVAIIAVMVVATAVLLLWRQQQRISRMELIAKTSKTELALHETEDRFRSIFDSATDGILIADVRTGKFIMGNPAIERMLGYNSKELLEVGVEEIHPAEALHQIMAGFNRQAAGDITLTPDLPVLRKDGSVFFADINASPVTIGGKACLMGIFHDITERKQTEVASKKNEQALMEAQQIGGFGSYEFDIVNDNWTSSPILDRIFGIDERYVRTTAGWGELIHPSQREEIINYLRGVIEQHQTFEKDYRIIRHNDGTERWVLGKGKMTYGSDGTPLNLTGTIQDITERKKTEDALRQSATVFESSHDGVTITDLDGNILAVNDAFLRITGYSKAEVLGQNPRILHSGRQGKEFYKKMWAAIKEDGFWRGEIWNRRKSGEIYPEQLTITTVKDDKGNTTHYVGVFSDLSQVKQSEERAEHLAHYDLLTELPNRLLVHSHLTRVLAQAQRHHHQVGVLYIDLDRFKHVNDSLGYPVGDELLVSLTQRLASRTRGEDMLARLGGDEFLLVLEHMDGPEDGAAVARSLLDLLTRPFMLSEEREIFIGASIGISVFPDDGSSAEQLIQHADAAMHQAKNQGRNTYRFYIESLTRAASEHLELETRLRHAIDANQLRVYYQPQVDITSGKIIGAEALVRWQDPERGLIPPIQFIPLAEETGLINAIGEWVFFETCRQGIRWIKAGLPNLTLAVNISPHQFMRGNITELVSKVLAETGFPADRLELELTESALMDQEEEAVKVLHLLRAQDIRLAIDDFGTGYSSLSYLKRFPLDILKIDKSFVDDIPFHQDDMEIAATIIAIGHTLGFKVLAEGVETAEQLAFLQAKGCDMYQGYLTSPPLPADEFEKLLIRK